MAHTMASGQVDVVDVSVRTVEDFDRWFSTITKRDQRAAAKITRAMTQMRSGDLSSNVKSVGGGVFQRSIDHGPGYRIYFGKDGQRLIIILGGATKSQRQQQNEIEASKSRWQNYQNQKQSDRQV